MEIVKKHDSGGLVWKRIKLTTTRKANAKKRLLRVWQSCGHVWNHSSENLVPVVLRRCIIQWRFPRESRTVRFDQDVNAHDQGFKKRPQPLRNYVTVLAVTATRYGRFCSVIEIHKCNEAVLKACAEPAPKPSVAGAAGIVEEDSNSTQSQ
ncbi:hypothetical protein CsSME_00004868 [Camellia sinensis var. sinensis]